MSEQEIMNLNQGYPLPPHLAAVRERASTGNEGCGLGGASRGWRAGRPQSEPARGS